MKRAIVLLGVVCLSACSTAKPGNSLLPPVTMVSPEGANHIAARFSPDGKRLFWWVPAGQGNELWTADADLANPTRLPVTALQTTTLLWSPDGSQILVPASTSGYVQVAVIPAAGGAPRALTDVTFAVASGWHPDGDRVSYGAFTGNKGAGTVAGFVTSLSRGGVTRLVPSESRPHVGAWTWDGSQIVYAIFEGGRTTIWAADSAGTNPRQLTSDGFENLSSTDGAGLSPDGKQIAYESRRTGTSDIWVIPLAGGTARQLTHDIRNDRTPIWSPDGRWIAFISERGKQTDVWVVPAAGGEEVRVTDDAAVEELMQWLPGNKLAFLTGEGQSSVWSMTLADSSERRLTADSIRATAPNLGPDGKLVVFLIDRGGGNADVAVIPAAGGTMRVLVQGGINSEVTWSPDGARLAFASDRGGTSDIWIVDVAGGEPRQVTNWPSGERTPAWSGDGSRLYFVSDRESQLGDVWQVAAAGGEPTRLTNHGAINGIATQHGRPELLAAVLEGKGLAGVQVKGDGKIVPIPRGSDALPMGLIPGTDSVVVADVGKGGRVGFRIIPLSGTGDGQALLKPGEGLTGASENWDWITYRFANGATSDIGLLNRKTGATRRLTNNSVDEAGAGITLDGNTVVFQRSNSVRRIAIADLTKQLGSAPKP